MFPLLLQHPFNSPLSRNTRVSQYQKGKTNLDLLEQEKVTVDQLSHMQICTSPRQITMPAPHHSLPPNEQRQGTEGMFTLLSVKQKCL